MDLAALLLKKWPVVNGLTQTPTSSWDQRTLKGFMESPIVAGAMDLESVHPILPNESASIGLKLTPTTVMEFKTTTF